MLRQKTIRQEAVYKGVGLHTGNACTVRFKPAPANSGVVFVRSDRPEIKIPASIEHVTNVVRGTSLGLDGVQVHTVEHICSALLGLEVDNLTVEMDASEPPVGDGSAQPFVDMLLKSGLQEQDAEKHVFTPTEPVVYRSNETEIVLEPAPELEIHCKLIFNHPLIGTQEASFAINTETYLKEIAPARTFCFDYEVEALKRKGLARGGSLDNAVVVGMDRIHNKEKQLRYPNEFVRHKILDFLGDFYLFGKNVRGKIRAVRVGHGHNINFVKELSSTAIGELTHG